MKLQPEICQNFKNMLRTYPRLREKQFIFYCFCFPKCRKSELHNVLHWILVHVNFFLSTHSYCTWSIIYLHCTRTKDNYNHWLILSICSLKVIRLPFWHLRTSVRTFPGWNRPENKTCPGSTRKWTFLQKKESNVWIKIKSKTNVTCVRWLWEVQMKLKPGGRGRGGIYCHVWAM